MTKRTYKLFSCDCGGQTNVVSARSTVVGVIRRRRCSECESVFETVEQKRFQETAIPATLLIDLAEELGLLVDRSR